MSFFMEYLRRKIAENMEDPEERSRKWEQHIRNVQINAKAAKTNMEYPTKSWGFWRSEKRTAVYEMNSDPAVAKLPGRARTTF